MSEIIFVRSESAGVFAVSLSSGTIEQHWKDCTASSVLPLGGRGHKHAGIFAALQTEKAVLQFHRWSSKGGQSLASLFRSSLPERLASALYSPCGAVFFGGGVSGKIYCWEASTGVLLRSWTAHYSSVSTLAFSADLGFLVSGSTDTSVKVFSLASMVDASSSSPPPALYSWSAHSLPISSLNIQGDKLFAGSEDGALKGWSLLSGKPCFSGFLPCPIASCILDFFLKNAFVGGGDGCIYEVDLSTGEAAKWGLGGHKGPVTSVSLSADLSRLVSCGVDGLRIWDVSTRQCVRNMGESALGQSPVLGACLLPRPQEEAPLHPLLRPFQRVQGRMDEIENLPPFIPLSLPSSVKSEKEALESFRFSKLFKEDEECAWPMNSGKMGSTENEEVSILKKKLEEAQAEKEKMAVTASQLYYLLRKRPGGMKDEESKKGHSVEEAIKEGKMKVQLNSKKDLGASQENDQEKKEEKPKEKPPQRVEKRVDVPKEVSTPQAEKTNKRKGKSPASSEMKGTKYNASFAALAKKLKQ